jgi:tetratricopeptide (TPR) repeat protein
MRKEDVREDSFVKLEERVIKAYYRSPRNFYIGAAVVVAAIVAVVVIATNKPKPNADANSRFDGAILMLNAPDHPDTAQAIQWLTDLARLYPGNPMGKRANYYLGMIYYVQQKYDEARHGFETFYGGDKSDPILSPAALTGIADCYEQQGNISAAAGAFAAAYRRYPKWKLSNVVAEGAGRCYIQLKQYKQAADIYGRYLKDNAKLVPPPVLDEVKMHLGYAQALAGQH